MLTPGWSSVRNKPPMKLLSPQACVKIGQRNVRTLFEAGKCVQVIKETQRYGVSILGISEMRWNSCGRLRIATGEIVLYSGMDEGENHVEPTGEAKERSTPANLATYENGRVGE